MEKKQKNKRVFNIVVRSQSPLEPLYLREIEVSPTEKTYKRMNDITLLFNQDRINKMVGIDTINHWLQGLSTSDSSVIDKLRKNVSDDDLLKFIKSRHIQSISELLLWSEYLEENYSKELERLNAETPAPQDSPINESVVNVTPE